MNSSNPVISISPPPPPPPPIPTPCKTIFGPIFQVTLSATSATLTPHLAYMWMEEKLHIATELIESALGNDRSLGVRNALAWFRATVDNYSDYFLPIIPIMLALVLGYSISVMVTRQSSKCCRLRQGRGDVVSVHDNPPKRLLRSLGSFIVSSFRLMASLVPYPVLVLAYIKAVEDVADIGFKFLHATGPWSDEWVQVAQQYLSWIGKETVYQMTSYD
ncbi:hypothetical protein FRC02_001523 [Tulasnella sp. 418]|nr:hypothetical protein FRC02_001523 [Tulasnella sp. 418]